METEAPEVPEGPLETEAPEVPEVPETPVGTGEEDISSFRYELNGHSYQFPTPMSEIDP